jgi:hypothetical protein
MLASKTGRFQIFALCRGLPAFGALCGGQRARKGQRFSPDVARYAGPRGPWLAPRESPVAPPASPSDARRRGALMQSDSPPPSQQVHVAPNPRRAETLAAITQPLVPGHLFVGDVIEDARLVLCIGLIFVIVKQRLVKLSAAASPQCDEKSIDAAEATQRCGDHRLAFPTHQDNQCLVNVVLV